MTKLRARLLEDTLALIQVIDTSRNNFELLKVGELVTEWSEYIMTLQRQLKLVSEGNALQLGVIDELRTELVCEQMKLYEEAK